MKNYFTSIVLAMTLFGCQNDASEKEVDPYLAIKEKFGVTIDPENLLNYEKQTKPAYITRDNTGTNPIKDEAATLGRVLFYDVQLSVDNTVACANCHAQEHAFSVLAQSSKGVLGGSTQRHSMRLVNSRFGAETKFFWNERAATLEDQVTKPIRDHAEMGYSGQDGRPNFDVLLDKLKNIGYYRELFKLAFGDEEITEARMQQSLAQFVRSIQSFDSKYDAGRSQVNADNQPFPNFSIKENQGKNLFLLPPQFDASGIRIAGGAGCGGCHAPPEFDIAPNTRNNGVIGTINSSEVDLTNTRSPSLRNLTDNAGIPNGPMMHNGIFNSLEEVVGHYNAIPDQPNNTNLDPRLRPNGFTQKLNLSVDEKDALVAFLKTLSGSAVYTDERWSSPFK
ncbi:MAG: cytochrome-c peroxidase [Bacteroidetes bacterium]|nr:cytochrome-c peroxidase [Bacteroidota bacterium]